MRNSTDCDTVHLRCPVVKVLVRIYHAVTSSRGQEVSLLQDQRRARDGRTWHAIKHFTCDTSCHVTSRKTLEHALPMSFRVHFFFFGLVPLRATSRLTTHHKQLHPQFVVNFAGIMGNSRDATAKPPALSVLIAASNTF